MTALADEVPQFVPERLEVGNLALDLLHSADGKVVEDESEVKRIRL
ncbi:hypothetical protein [Belnapia rosea]|nr:hypothetical protein [Belnapia rosea]